MTQMVGSPTSVSINTTFWPKPPSGKAFQAKIDWISIASRVRRTRERLPSDGFIERAPQNLRFAPLFL